MYCSKCGASIDPNHKFCQSCGAVIERNDSQNLDENNVFENTQPSQETITQTTKVNDDVNAESITEEIAEVKADDQSTEENEEYVSVTNYYYEKPKPDKSGTASLILGIVSILSSLMCLISVPTGIAGLVMGIKSKVKSSTSKAGIILSSVGLALTAIFIIGLIIIIVLFSINVSGDTFYGDGFYLDYDKNWSETFLNNEQEALQYKNENSFLAPIGVSALSEYPSDFSTISGQNELYQDFYDYWNESEETLQIFSGSDGFSEFTDSIYYATYNYGVTSDDIKGKYILLVSEEYNAVLSFMTNSSENVEENDERALELLKNIEIYYQDDTSEYDDYDDYDDTDDTDYEVIYDDEMYNTLDSLRDWNRFSELREGDLGKNKSINGGWRILSDSETYWEFKNGKFWWYESVNELNDNYWQGTTKVLTGKTGLSSVGLDESKIDLIINQSSGNVTANDIYTIVCTPTKIISGGKDKSDTNIPEDTQWHYVWIVVDHGAEGIEAQVLNIDNYDVNYFVKIKD